MLPFHTPSSTALPQLQSPFRGTPADGVRPANAPISTTLSRSLTATSEAIQRARPGRCSGNAGVAPCDLRSRVELAVPAAGSTLLTLPSGVGTGSLRPYGVGGVNKVEMFSAGSVRLAGASVPASASKHTVAAQTRAAFERTRPRKEAGMGLSELMSAPAADAASVLEHELTRKFQSDGIVDFDERRLLRLARALTRETNRVDANLAVLMSGFRIDGIRGRQFRRKLREFDADFDPEPDGPAAKRKAA